MGELRLCSLATRRQRMAAERDNLMAHAEAKLAVVAHVRQAALALKLALENGHAYPRGQEREWRRLRQSYMDKIDFEDQLNIVDELLQQLDAERRIVEREME